MRKSGNIGCEYAEEGGGEILGPFAHGPEGEASGEQGRDRDQQDGDLGVADAALFAGILKAHQDGLQAVLLGDEGQGIQIVEHERFRSFNPWWKKRGGESFLSPSFQRADPQDLGESVVAIGPEW